MSAPGLGYLPDQRDARDLRFGAARVASSAVALTAPDQEAYVQRVREQLTTQSCVGQSLAAAAELCASIAGQALYLSARWAYVLGLEAEQPGYKGFLQDRGSYPRLVMNAVQKRGLLREAAWPFSVADVVRRPSPLVAVGAYNAVGLLYYRIDEAGPARITAIEEALVRARNKNGRVGRRLALTRRTRLARSQGRCLAWAHADLIGDKNMVRCQNRHS